jgi:hypothetical protein
VHEDQVVEGEQAGSRQRNIAPSSEAVGDAVHQEDAERTSTTLGIR